MDPDFLSKLESHVSNIGTDECWKRTIGGRVIWMSPVMLEAQAKINETLASDELGAAALSEAKRVTLSHAVVGIDDIDLREHRGGPAVFPVVDPRIQKEVKVTLEKYMYLKMGKWGAEFIDQTFEVFADLMVSHHDANLRDVKFENAKDPHEELMEAEARVAELRDQLGMIPLSEMTESEAQDIGDDFKKKISASPSEEKYDPFEPVVSPEEPPSRQLSAQPTPTPTPLVQPTPTPLVQPTPLAQSARSVPSAVAPSQPREIGKESSPDQPFRASDSMGDVIERPASRVHTEPPKIDRTRHQSVNPRFSPPKR